MGEREQKVIRIIAENLGLNESVIRPSTTLCELQVDSLSQVEIAMALEDEFDIDVPDDVCGGWTTVADVIWSVK